MSRCDVKPARSDIEVCIGWDPPLETFFAQVLTDLYEDDGPREILWEGTRFGAHPEPDDLISMIRPHAAPFDGARLRSDLLADKESDSERTYDIGYDDE